MKFFEGLLVLVVLGIIIWLVNWLQQQSENSSHEHGGCGDPSCRGKKMSLDSLPPFEGGVLELPKNSGAVDYFQITLKRYVRSIRDLERVLGLGEEQSFRIQDVIGVELQGLRYSVSLLNLLLKEGRVDTKEVYERYLKSGQDFYPDLFADACSMLREDILSLAE